MDIWAIADLHLPFGVPQKTMEIFGPEWKNYTTKLQSAWDRYVTNNDLVLIAGDISWASRPEEARADLQWIDDRPGTKLMIKGNHDYWWSSLSKVQKILPSSIRLIQNNALSFHPIAITGTRLWTSHEFSFEAITNKQEEKNEQDERLFTREIQRLERCLEQLDPSASLKIAMTHFPPIGYDLTSTQASQLFEKYGISLVVFGHLHALPPTIHPLFGTKNGVRYVLTSADWLQFSPIHLGSY